MNIAYRPLRQKHDEIRLLHLEAARQLDDPLRGTLRHTKLHDASFCALSYVWGDTTKDRSEIGIKYERTTREFLSLKLSSTTAAAVRIHGIGSSLARALRYLRQKYGNTTIWTDALCINQSDNIEKDWQVPLMSAIYSRAKEVHAWLGPRYDEDIGVIHNVNAAFDVADTIWRLAEQIPNSPNHLPEEDWLGACLAVTSLHQSDQALWNQFAIELRRAATSGRLRQSDLITIDAVSRNDYFSRMWILQEMGRARKLTFHFGMKEISHRRMLLAVGLANSLRDPRGNSRLESSLPRFDNRFYGCLLARTTCLRKASLREVLAAAYFAPPLAHQAGDPKDLIYARLGLSANPGDIQVIYDLSVAEVFVAASRYLLLEGFLEILVAFRPYRFLDGTAAAELPSWAYDWSRKAFTSFDMYTASRDTSQKVAIAPYRDVKFKHVLTMAGANIGTVAATNQRFSACVLAAGLHKKTVALGSLSAVSDELSIEKKNTLLHNIHDAYLQLGIEVPDADIEALFNYRSLPFASFWCWWVYWIASLVSLIEGAEFLRSDEEPRDLNVAELLFREDPGALKNNANIRRYGSKTGILSLLEFRRWSTLLSRTGTPNDQSESLAAQFANSLFRSAWGMRPALLSSGRMGYVPEDTQSEDDVVIFYGVKAPLVIRRATKDAYRIIGPAHICGAMQGELMDLPMSNTTYRLV